MTTLAVQVRLTPEQLAAIDQAREVQNPLSGLPRTVSRQEVIKSIIDQWMAAKAAPKRS
jgi:hypothetical protein